MLRPHHNAVGRLRRIGKQPAGHIHGYYAGLGFIQVRYHSGTPPRQRPAEARAEQGINHHCTGLNVE